MRTTSGIIRRCKAKNLSHLDYVRRWQIIPECKIAIIESILESDGKKRIPLLHNVLAILIRFNCTYSRGCLG